MPELPPLSASTEIARSRLIRYIKDVGLARKGERVEDIMTCDTCQDRNTCRSRYDTYNTDGDCLEDK